MNRRRGSTSIAALLALGVVLGACGAKDTAEPSGAPASTPGTAGTPPAVSTPAEPGVSTPTAGTEGTVGTVGTVGTEVVAPPAVPSALQFSGTLVGGGAFDASVYAGKPLALWFWAPG